MVLVVFCGTSGVEARSLKPYGVANNTVSPLVYVNQDGPPGRQFPAGGRADQWAAPGAYPGLAIQLAIGSEENFVGQV